MTLAAQTDKTEVRPCSKCGVEVLHHEIEVLSCGPEQQLWFPTAHSAACGVQCMNGSRGATITSSHGWRDRCPTCGPLRLLPEVVAEMRARATDATDLVRYEGTGRADIIRGLAADVLRALDEIEKLTTERDEAREALDGARDQLTALRMELADGEIATEEAKGETR